PPDAKTRPRRREDPLRGPWPKWRPKWRKGANDPAEPRLQLDVTHVGCQVAAPKDRYQGGGWDFRGHGESDYPKDASLYSEALTVGDMLALLDLIGARKAIVAGLSLGGYMSLAFHASHPDRVRALMLFDTGPGFKKDEARAKW